LKKAARREIRKSEPPIAANLQAVDVPAAYSKIVLETESEDFLIYDSGPTDPRRMLIFATNEGLKLLAASDDWYMDGTFKTCPPPFYQLYTIRAKFEGGTATCVYALMAGKTTNEYDQMFTAVLERCMDLELDLLPRRVHLDFEHGPISAAQNIFGGGITIVLCFFHLKQSVWRKVQSLGLSGR
jgi:hypothetical protein